MSPFIVVEPWERFFELFRMQNSQDFLKLCLWTPLVRFCSASRLPSCTTIFFFAMLVETLVCPPSLPSPKKKNWILDQFLSFYTCVLQVLQMTIIWCMVPEIWSMTDRIFCHFGLFFFFLWAPSLSRENINLIWEIT